MSWDRARDALDEIHTRRVAEDPAGVRLLAEQVWAAAAAWDPEQRTGLAAVCQATFVALVGAEDPALASTAPLWRARATRVAAETGEVAAAAMLLIPIAADAAGRGDLDTALAVLDEVGAVADAVARGGVQFVEPPLATLRRAHREKKGHLLWRAARYAEAVDEYAAAVSVAPLGRDALRAGGGLLLARLGADLVAGTAVDRATVAAELRAIATEARDGGWLDVARPADAAADVVGGPALLDVQDLPSFEIEPGRSPSA